MFENANAGKARRRKSCDLQLEEDPEPEPAEFWVIYKVGDDLRADMLVLRLLAKFDEIWKKEKLDFKLNAYGCISTGDKEGLICVVPNSTTIASIQKKHAGSGGILKAASTALKSKVLPGLQQLSLIVG